MNGASIPIAVVPPTVAHGRSVPPAVSLGTRTQRIVLFDGSPIFRAGLRAMLSCVPELDVAVVAESGAAVDGRALLERSAPEIAIVDAAMIEPPESWIRMVRRIAPQTRLLVMASHDDLYLAEEFLSMGVDGYMIRDDPPEVLVSAIRALLAGETYVSARVPVSMAEFPTRQHAVPSVARLSKREREVFRMFVLGYTSLHVARELHLSVKTVQTHRSRINRKLGVHSAAELLRFASLRGLVRP
jgi:DNA-binding NarL/FixJ family response regulator